MSKDTEAKQDPEYLTSLPPELLIKVLSEVPLSSFLDLTKTSRALREFIKTNAARICNMAIRSRLAYEAKILEATTNNKEGRLLPAPKKLKKMKTCTWRLSSTIPSGGSYVWRKRVVITVSMSLTRMGAENWVTRTSTNIDKATFEDFTASTDIGGEALFSLFFHFPERSLRSSWTPSISN
jgi:hypothetical protein